MIIVVLVFKFISTCFLGVFKAILRLIPVINKNVTVITSLLVNTIGYCKFVLVQMVIIH